MTSLLQHWQFFALGSAFFAALTAIFGKVGVAKNELRLGDPHKDRGHPVCHGVTRDRAPGVGAPGGDPYKRPCFSRVLGRRDGLSWLCYFRALQLGPASRVAPIDKLSVVLVVLLSAAFLGERPGWNVSVGVGLMAAGAILSIPSGQ
jgi:bacterial/archaeal transporter family protein